MIRALTHHGRPEARAHNALGPRERALCLVLFAAGLLAYRDAILYLPPSLAGGGGLAGGSGPNPIEDLFYVPAESAPQVVYLVFAFLLWRRWQALRSAAVAGAGSPVLGLSLLALGTVAFGWSLLARAVDVAQLSFVIHVLGAGAWLGGGALVRLLLFPCAALLLAIPPPAAWVNQVMFPLQLATVELTTWLLDLARIPHFVMGDHIEARGRLFQVIEACSGLRAMLSLSLAAFVLAEVSCRTPLGRLGLVLLAPCVAFAVNGLRVVVVILDPASAVGRSHALQGVGMVLLGALLLVALERLGSRLAPDRGAGEAAASPRPAPHAGSLPRAWLPGLAGLTLVLAAGSWILPRVAHVRAAQPGVNLHALPSELGAWQSSNLKPDREFLGGVRFHHDLYRRYRRGGEEVTLFAGLEDPTRRERSGLSPKTRIPRSGWLALQELPAGRATRAGDAAIERLVLRYPKETLLVHHWRRGYQGSPAEVLRAALALDPLLGSRAAVVFRLETEVKTPYSGGTGPAEARLAQFRAELEEAAARLWRR